jgi:hypothetical protein
MKNTFTTLDGQTWQIKLTVSDLLRVREVTGYDLLEDAGSNLTALVVVKVCTVLCDKHIRFHEITPEKFANSFDVAVIDEARGCVLEALSLFFQRSRPRVASLLREAAAEAFGRCSSPTVPEPASAPTTATDSPGEKSESPPAN